MMNNIKQWKSEGDGRVDISKFKKIGENVIFEDGVRVFHPENIIIGDNVYIGHNTMLKGYYKHELVIGSNTWIGQGCFIHGAGGVKIGEMVGIGPHVKIHAAYHMEKGIESPILFTELAFSPITIENNCNIGIGAIILPGVVIEEGSKIGANAVVNKSIPKYSVAVGVPAKIVKERI